VEETGIEAHYESSFTHTGDPGGSPMNVFADSSALAKRYMADEQSSDMDEVLERATNLAVSILCVTEIISALCRRRRERFLKPSEYATAKNALEADLADAAIIQITDEVLIQSIRLFESHPLRSSDAIQVSSALVWRADRFVSADSRQCAAAKAAGLNVVKMC
jgi:predicted nucleic acid-binding protein